MNFELMIKVFFDGVSVSELVQKYNIKYVRLCSIIKGYCLQNNIIFDDEIKNRLELPLFQIYEEKKNGLSDQFLADKYKCSIPIIRKYLKGYCEDKHLEYPSLELPLSQIYEEKKNGVSDQILADKYKCSVSTLRKYMRKYCDDENLEYPSLELPLSQIYEQKKNGVSDPVLANRYKCSILILRKYIKKYCDDKNLEYPSLNLLLSQIYEQRQKGMSYQTLADEYQYSISTIRYYLKKYCRENGLNKYTAEKKEEYQVRLLLDLKEILLNVQNNNLNDNNIICIKRR